MRAKPGSMGHHPRQGPRPGEHQPGEAPPSGQTGEHGQPTMGPAGSPVPGRVHHGAGGGRHKQLRPRPFEGVRE